MGKLVRGYQVNELFRHRRILIRLEREVQLLQREPVDMAVDRIPRVVGHGVGEAGVPQTPDRRVHVAQHDRPGIGPRHDEHRRPRVSHQHDMGRYGAAVHRRPPVAADAG
jgi:hypothetical protein